MSIGVTDTPENIAYRLGRVEQRIEHIDENKAETADLKDLTLEVRGLRKVLITLLLTIAGSTLVFAGGVIGIAANLSPH